MREGAEQHTAHGAENGGVRADPQPHGHDKNQCEARAFDQAPKRVPKVPYHRLHHHPHTPCSWFISVPKTIGYATSATGSTEQGSRQRRPVLESQLQSREERVRRGVPPEAHRAAHPSRVARLLPLEEHMP